MKPARIWLGDWVWSLTFILARRKGRTMKESSRKADEALARYKKRVRW